MFQGHLSLVFLEEFPQEVSSVGSLSTTTQLKAIALGFTVSYMDQTSTQSGRVIEEAMPLGLTMSLKTWIQPEDSLSLL